MPLVRILFFSLLVVLCSSVYAQEGATGTGSMRTQGGVGNNGRPMGPNSRTSGGDSLTHRTGLEDSITISYRYFDSSRSRQLDSNVLNLVKRIPVPFDHLFLGNLGSATRPILFSPRMTAGFDPGFHAYDVYQYKLEDTKFFQATRPYSELGYIIGGRAEQTISVLYTQNIKPTWNATFDFRFQTSPGALKNLQNNNRGLRLSTSFKTKKLRYSGFLVWYSNKVSAGESGGILGNAYMDDVRYSDRFLIPTKLGGDGQFNSNFFSSTDVTGAFYKNSTFYVRHQYDFGQKDSIVTDSTVIKLFYPRIRIQHNFWVGNSQHSFRDASSVDSVRKYYGYTSLSANILFKDVWKEIKNEFALILFPEKQNQNQFLKLGAAYQILTGTLDNTTLSLNNLYLLGEYRNRTRNKKWDINANGQLFVTGFNAGDYTAQIQLQAFLGKRFGDLVLGFQNTNHSPSFVYDNRSSFPLLPSNASFNKENITHLFASVHETKLNIGLSGHYYLVANYLYFDSFYHASQASGITSVLQISAEKKFKLTRRWNLYSEFHFQQPTGNTINLPALYTRQRLVFEGTFFKNLDAAAGLDLRYFSPFKADNYSPLTQQFFLQETTTLRNRPDIAAFFHFRIKSFNCFIRAENLGTLSFSPGFGFLNNNFAAPLYPTPGFFLRFGFKWGFVN
ncbi:MAG: putative porin [Bacteroidota bacterium]